MPRPRAALSAPPGGEKKDGIEQIHDYDNIISHIIPLSAKNNNLLLMNFLNWRSWSHCDEMTADW